MILATRPTIVYVRVVWGLLLGEGLVAKGATRGLWSGGQARRSQFTAGLQHTTYLRHGSKGVKETLTTVFALLNVVY